MTDRSTYGPVRRLSPSVSTDNRKPYSRTGLKGVLGTLDLNSGDAAVPTPSDSPYYPLHAETLQLEAPTQSRTSVPDGPRDVAGFPSYEQYQRIEGEYLSSLSERKQPKALISQALFDKVLAVLQNGSEDRASTAQFRFWVRKMFVLIYPQTSFNPSAGQTTEPVVLHDKRPVAIKEKLYEVLCYCHAAARHGGRDKTCATLRLNYSWVPKELTAKFVKACPTCTLKRSGNPDLLSQFGSSSPYAPPPPLSEPASLPVFSGGPNDSPPPGLSFVVGSEGCDDGGGGSAGFGSSMFATPDLSVYPSPTLSAGSLGPATPSPYLSSGLFGYPTVFDPGHHHGNLSPVTGWDTASCFSPCDLMYPDPEDFKFKLHAGGFSQQGDTPVSAEGMQLHLPTTQTVGHPSCARAHGDDCDNAGGAGAADDDGGGCSADPLQRIVGTGNNIDPVLLIEGRYSPFAFVVGPTRTAAADDADADMENLAGATPTRNESSSSNSCGSRVFQQQQQHQHHHQRHPPPQFGLALGSVTPAMGDEQASITSGPQRQRRLQLLLSPTHHEEDGSSGTTRATDACSGSFSRDRGDVPDSLLSLPPVAAPGPVPGASSNSAPVLPRGHNSLMNMMMYKFASPTTPTTMSMPPTTAGERVLGMRMGIEEPQGEEEELQLRLEDANANAFDTERASARVNMPLAALDGNKEARAARCRCRYQWDSPNAWLIQSDSIDEDVSVAAVV